MWEQRVFRRWETRKLAMMVITFTVAAAMLLPGFGFAGHSAPNTKVLIDGDFICSYDAETDQNDALHPQVAVTPSTDYCLEQKIAGSVHVVWDEVDETTGLREIHYSMSLPEDHGAQWSNDEMSEDDRAISDNKPGRANWGDAINPDIAIDSMGIIHVVWAEQYPDGTWEMHYTRSDDNGKTWLSESQGDTMVSWRRGEGDAPYVSAPSIAISMAPLSKAPETIHVAWMESAKGNDGEILYSQSQDQGASWSGQTNDRVISDTVTREGAYSPVIATSGNAGEFVHVAWRQFDPATGTDEIFYARSIDAGVEQWEKETEISYRDTDSMEITDVAIAASKYDVHVAWAQGIPGKAPPPGEIYYSTSLDANGEQGSWSGTFEDIRVSMPDGNQAEGISIGVSSQRDVYVAWSEVESDSSQKSKELHTSWTDESMIPYTWTGQDKDIVLSWPDPNEKADVNNVSMTVARNNLGEWKPTYVWDELNVKSGKVSRADKNTEIHTIPEEFTLSVSVSGSGSVNKNPNQSTYYDGDSVTLTANPSAGWYFDHWSGDAWGSTNPKTITIDGDMSITAVFYQYQYTFNTFVSPAGKGSVAKSPSQTYYTYGQTVWLTATPIPGWEFSHWTGSATGSSNPTSVYVNGNEAATAYFTQITYDIPVSSGWNYISTPLVPLDSSMPTVLTDLDSDTSWTHARWYDATDITEVLAVTNEHVFGPAAGGETGPFNLAKSDIKDLTLYSDQDGFLVQGQDYTVEWATGGIDISVGLSEMQPGEDLWAFYNYTKKGDPWKSYIVGGSMNDLANLDEEQGAWVYVTTVGDGFIKVGGERPTGNVIGLEAGWNMVGYPATDDSAYTVANLKTDTGATIVQGFNATAPYNIQTLSDSYVLQRGEAYWIKMGSTGTWTVSW